MYCHNLDVCSNRRKGCRKRDIYLFDGIQHHIADDCRLFLLAEPYRTTDGLGFEERVPLGLDDVYPGCNSEVKPSSLVSNSICQTGYSLDNAPHSAGAKRNQEYVCLRVLLEGGKDFVPSGKGE
jgi:hypothetical protein